MPHKIERKIAFGPSAPEQSGASFRYGVARIACLGIDANTDEQIQWIKTKLAQRIMEYAEEGERDVAHLKEFGLQGLPHLCGSSSRAATTAFTTTGGAATSALAGKSRSTPQRNPVKARASDL
jgi:hypothetical protein